MGTTPNSDLSTPQPSAQTPSTPSVEAPNADASSSVDDMTPGVLASITEPFVDRFSTFLNAIGEMTPDHVRSIHRYFVELGLHIKTLPFDPKNEELRTKLRRYAAVEIIFAGQLFEYGDMHRNTFANTPEGEEMLESLHQHISLHAVENKAMYDNPNVRVAGELEGLVEMLNGIGVPKQ